MKLQVQPESSSYNLNFGQEALRTELEGGLGRYRQDIVGASTKLQGIQFRCDPEQYEYLLAFWRNETKRGAEPFEMDLYLDNADLVECVCHFMSPITLSQQSGLTFVVSADIEVTRAFDPDEATDDVATIAAYNLKVGYTP